MTRRAAIGFLSGMGLSGFGLFVLPLLLGTVGFFARESTPRLLLVLVIPTLVGGAVAGASLREGRRGSVGFALAFPIGVFLPTLGAVGIQAMSGRETLMQLLVVFAGSFSLSFGLMGAVGVAFLGRGWRIVVYSALVFAASGVIGGGSTRHYLTACDLGIPR